MRPRSRAVARIRESHRVRFSHDLGVGVRAPAPQSRPNPRGSSTLRAYQVPRDVVFEEYNDLRLHLGCCRGPGASPRRTATGADSRAAPAGCPTQVGPGVRATPLASRLASANAAPFARPAALHCGKPRLELETRNSRGRTARRPPAGPRGRAGRRLARRAAWRERPRKTCGQKDTPTADGHVLVAAPAGYFAAFFLRSAQEAVIRSETAFFSSAVIGRRFLVGLASGAVSATGVAAAAGRREEERRAVGFAGAERRTRASCRRRSTP